MSAQTVKKSTRKKVDDVRGLKNPKTGAFEARRPKAGQRWRLTKSSTGHREIEILKIDDGFAHYRVVSTPNPHQLAKSTGQLRIDRIMRKPSEYELVYDPEKSVVESQSTTEHSVE